MVPRPTMFLDPAHGGGVHAVRRRRAHHHRGYERTEPKVHRNRGAATAAAAAAAAAGRGLAQWATGRGGGGNGHGNENGHENGHGDGRGDRSADSVASNLATTSGPAPAGLGGCAFDLEGWLSGGAPSGSIAAATAAAATSTSSKLRTLSRSLGAGTGADAGDSPPPSTFVYSAEGWSDSSESSDPSVSQRETKENSNFDFGPSHELPSLGALCGIESYSFLIKENINEDPSRYRHRDSSDNPAHKARPKQEPTFSNVGVSCATRCSQTAQGNRWDDNHSKPSKNRSAHPSHPQSGKSSINSTQRKGTKPTRSAQRNGTTDRRPHTDSMASTQTRARHDASAAHGAAHRDRSRERSTDRSRAQEEQRGGSARQQQRQTQPQTAAVVAQRRVWKTAVDPKSGRTYYYDSVTRETQWRKPIELASDEERRAIREKERKQREFFAAMEGNILRSMERGVIPGTPSPVVGEERETVGRMTSGTKQKKKMKKKIVKLLSKGSKPTGGTVRTISSMNNDVLAEMTKVGGGATPTKSSCPDGPSPTSVSSQSLFVGMMPMRPGAREDRAIAQVRRVADEMAQLDGPLDGLDRCGSDDSNDMPASPPKTGDLRNLTKPTLSNRNTCGTMYVGSTMAAPDKDATIKCVCGVFRAHMLQAAKDEASSGFRPPVKFDEYEIFNDRPKDRRGSGGDAAASPLGHRRGGVGPSRSYDHGSGSSSVLVSHAASGIEALSLESVERAVPSLDEISAFYRDVFRRSQMETDCIIMSLIYVERLIKETNGGVRPRVGNWRSILFAAMVMSSKVWDDLSMWNVDFSQTCPAGVRFTLRRINELELAMLDCLKFVVKVPASEYAKYYFLLRSMMIRSGLAGEDLSSMSPLDLKGARNLEVLSANFQAGAGTGAKRPDLLSRRCRTSGEVEGRVASPTGPMAKVSLEQVVRL